MERAYRENLYKTESECYNSSIQEIVALSTRLEIKYQVNDNEISIMILLNVLIV